MNELGGDDFLPYYNPSYTNRDFDSIKQWLVSLIPQLTPNWTDFNESDIGMALVELMAAYGDMLSFQLDMQALETYLPTVQQRQNAQNILKLLNYQLQGYRAERATVNITQTQLYNTPVKIPAYFQLSTQGTSPIYYVTQSPVTFSVPVTYPLMTDTLTEYTTTPPSWSVLFGSFSFGLSGATSNVNGSMLQYNSSSWQPLQDSSGVVHPLVVSASFTTPSTINPQQQNLSVYLYQDSGDYYQLNVGYVNGKNSISLIKNVNSTSTVLVSSSFGELSSTEYVLSLSLDTNGHLSGNIYNSSALNVALASVTSVDNSLSGPFYTVYGADAGVIISNVEVQGPPSLATNFSQTLSVNVWSGQPRTYTINYSDISSNGTYTLSDQNVDTTTITLTVGNTVWKQVENVLYQTNNNYVYSVTFNDQYPIIQFPPNWQNILSPNQTITIQYVVTNGPADSVGSNTITVFVNPILDSNGNNVTSMFTVTNPQPSSGGSLPESIDNARVMAPLVAFEQQTLITLNDYETAVKNYSGVYDAIAQDVNTPGAGITQTLFVRIYVVPDGLYQPSPSFLNEIQTYLLEKSLPGMTVQVLPPTYYTINFNINAYVPSAYSSYNYQVQSAITSWLQNYFTPSNITFNSVIRYSPIVTGIQTSSPYIKYIEMTPSSDIVIPNGQYPLLGNISVNVVNI